MSVIEYVVIVTHLCIVCPLLHWFLMIWMGRGGINCSCLRRWTGRCYHLTYPTVADASLSCLRVYAFILILTFSLALSVFSFSMEERSVLSECHVYLDLFNNTHNNEFHWKFLCPVLFCECKELNDNHTDFRLMVGLCWRSFIRPWRCYTVHTRVSPRVTYTSVWCVRLAQVCDLLITITICAQTQVRFLVLTSFCWLYMPSAK